MIFCEQAHTKKIFCMYTRTPKYGFLINDLLRAGECEEEEDSLHAYAYDEKWDFGSMHAFAWDENRDV